MNTHNGKPTFNNFKRKLTALLLSVVFATALCTFITPQQAEAAFTLSPSASAYAKEFYAKCEGQQWFIELIETTLNVSARSINTLNSKADLDIITSVATDTVIESGSLPRAIGELSKLRFLFLDEIGLTGGIPEELCNCLYLENIDLSSNELTGQIPAGIAALTKLTVLQLDGNRLSGTIPVFPQSLQNLDLANNELTGGIPASLGSLTALKILALSNNSLGGEIPPSLGNITELRILLAWNCDLTGTIPPAIAVPSNLQILDLSLNNLAGEVPAALMAHQKLERLSIADNNFIGAVPQAISSMPSLKVLDISGNKFIGNIPAGLVAMQNSGAKIYIERNYLFGDNVSEIQYNIENFDIHETDNYQLKLYMADYTRLSKDTAYNVYSAFSTRKADSNTSFNRAKLPALNYELVCLTTLENSLENPDEFFEITRDDNGIYIKLLKEIPADEAIEFMLRMLPYDAAESYSFIRFKVGTGSMSTETPQGGGGTQNTPAEGEESPTVEPETIQHKAYMSGFPDGTFRPDDNLTREQAAMILWRIQDAPDTVYDKSFPDVEIGRWSAKAITFVHEQGLMVGYPDGTFKPGNPITRAEFTTILVRYRGYGKAVTNAFSDIAGHWAEGFIGTAYSYGMMVGYPDGSFKPESNITRAEVATAVNHTLGRVPSKTELEKIPSPYLDANTEHWAYAQIIEASTSHNTVYNDGVEAWND